MRTARFVLLLFVFLVNGAAAQVDLFVTDYLAPQTAGAKPPGDHPTTVALLRATPGEYEPFTFLLRPRERYESVFVKPAGPLAGEAGRIEAARIEIRAVEDYHGGEFDALGRVGRPWDLPAWQAEAFWVTVHVPDNAAPGLYNGEIVVTSNDQRIGALPVALEVLPFQLDEPPYALGFNYSSPRNPKALAAHLRDMRAHGMTSVGPLYNFDLPIHDAATSELGAFLEAYRAAGFARPVYFAAPMSLMPALAGYGPVDSRRFQQKYLKTMRLLFDETQRHDVPVIFSIADELTNQALPGIATGEQLARLCFEELPEIATASDMNGYQEVVTMAPYLNVAAFNNGWDGIDHHNRGRRLINREFIGEVQGLGAIPWFVNGGLGRFAYGFFFWKMAGYGVQGKIEWYYNLGENERGSVVRCSGERIDPTLVYERSREGIDDLKYVLRLEKSIAQARQTRQAGRVGTDAVRGGEALLAELRAAVIDNWTAYTSGGEAWSPEQLHAWRRRIIDAILAIEPARRSR